MRFLDAHSDLINDLALRRAAGERDVFRTRHQGRLRRGGCTGAVLALWVESAHRNRPLERTAELLSAFREEMAEGALCLARTAGELATSTGDVFPALLCAEGLAAVGGDEGLLDTYYAQGVRMAMLTWNESNALASGALSGEDGGLTPAGIRVLRRMRRLGMAIDVSHLNDAGFWDVVRLAEGPVLASHSNSRALCPSPRNLTDDQLRAVRDTGGVVGLNAYRGFVAEAPQKQTVRTLALHAAHMAEVMGVEHVCCGFDFCEFLPGEGDCNVSGLPDCGEAGNLFSALEALGFTEAEREAIARGNLLRVLERVIGP